MDSPGQITGDESLEQLRAKLLSSSTWQLQRTALVRFLDRFLQDGLTAAEVEEIGDLLESDRVDHDNERDDGLIAQVLFEMSSPEVNGTIDAAAAKRWRETLETNVGG
jgi:hypothetical protein